MEERVINFASSQRNRYEISNDLENFHPDEDISSVSPSPRPLGFLDSVHDRFKSSPHSDQEVRTLLAEVINNNNYNTLHIIKVHFLLWILGKILVKCLIFIYKY